MITALLLLTLLLAACTSGSETSIPQLAVTLADGSDASGRTISVGAEGEEIVLNIESNSAWVVEASADWIAPARLAGNDNGTITLNIGAAEQSRSATISTYLTDYKQIKSTINIVQHVTPAVDEPTEDDTESPEDSTPPEQENPENNTDDNTPDEPNNDTTESDENQPAGAYIKIDKLSQLTAGEYYIGGYQDGVLHLATEGMQVGHCKTTEYTFTENGDLIPKEQSATPVTLEAAAENDYYIHFKDGYLCATAAGAGKLTLTDEKLRYWIFSAHADGGFVVRQAGEIDVQLIISPKAKDGALLRSVAGDEQGNAIILFRKNK